MADTQKISSTEECRKAEEARGWLRVLELAERQRRLREDGRVLRLLESDDGERAA